MERRLLTLLAVTAWLVAAIHLGPPIAPIFVLPFLAIGPGSAVVRGLDLREPLLDGAMRLGASFALGALVAETMIYLHIFTGARVVGVLAVITVVGVWRRRSTPTAPARDGAAVTVGHGGAGGVALDRSVPVLMVRIGRYPVYHGGVCAVRTFGRAGVPVYAIVEDRFTPAAVSRYLEEPIVWPTTGAESEELLLEGLARIGRRLGGGVLAVPSDDEAAVFLAEHGEILRDWFLYPAIEPGLTRRLASKRGLYEVCGAHDIPRATTAFPKTFDDIVDFAHRATFPIVMKNVDPFVRLHRRSVAGTTVASTPEELLEIASTFEDPTTVMLQEYLPRETSEDWIFHTYCDASSESLAPFTGIKLRAWPPHAGVTTYARIVRNEELEALSVRACRDIGYRGVADLDWRFDRRDGRYKLVDFNPRMGAQFKLFETESGVDVLRALHLDLTGRPVPQSPPLYGKGIKIGNLDLPAWFAYRRGHATAPPNVDAGPRPERAWLATDDPLPFMSMVARFSGPAFGRLASLAVPRRRHKHPGARTPATASSNGQRPAAADAAADVASTNGHGAPGGGAPVNGVPARRHFWSRKRVESTSPS